MVEIKTKEIVEEFPSIDMQKIGNTAAGYIADAVAEEAQDKFPIKITGITAGAIAARAAKKKSDGTQPFTVGIRAWALAYKGRKASYLGNLQAKYNFVGFFKKLVPKWRRKIVPGLMRAVEKNGKKVKQVKTL